MRQIRNEVLFQRPCEVAFDYVTTLGHWTKWYPATHAVEGDADRPAKTGEAVVERVRKLGLDGTLRWVVRSSERARHFEIETTSVDMPIFGGAHLHLTYDFEPAAGGCRMHRLLEYSLKPGLLRAVIDRVHLYRDLTRETEVALRKLQALVGASDARVPIAHASPMIANGSS
jgi:hypothetical protein